MQDVEGVGAERPQHPAPSGGGGIPAPGTTGIGSGAHQPVELHQPGGAQHLLLQQGRQLLKDGNGAVLEVNRHRQMALQGQALQRLDRLRLQCHRLFQQQRLASRQGRVSHCQARFRWGGDHQSVDARVGEKRLEVGAARQVMGLTGLGKPLRTRMPEGHRLGEGTVPQGDQMHLFTKAKAGDGDAQGGGGHGVKAEIEIRRALAPPRRRRPPGSPPHPTRLEPPAARRRRSAADR